MKGSYLLRALLASHGTDCTGDEVAGYASAQIPVGGSKYSDLRMENGGCLRDSMLRLALGTWPHATSCPRLDDSRQLA